MVITCETSRFLSSFVTWPRYSHTVKKGSIVCLMICEETFSSMKKKKKKVVLGGAISEFNLDSMNNLNNGGGGVLRKFLAL